MIEPFVIRSDQRVERTPAGIMVGAEERDLGSPNAAGVVVFVHGHLGAGDNFGDLPDRVAAAGWRARVMRLPGHGTHPWDHESITTGDMIEAVRTEVKAMISEHEKVVLVGHSMGATISTMIASEEELDGVVLGAPYYRVPYHWYYVLPPETWARVVAYPCRWVYKGKVFMQVKWDCSEVNITSYEWAPTKSVVMLTQLGSDAAAPGVPENVHAPVLWLHAPDDAAACNGAASSVMERLPHPPRHVTLPQSNHLIFVDNDREMVDDAVLDFLREIGESDKPQDYVEESESGSVSLSSNSTAQRLP
jgi:alpha-beta hydrolase superfamily lysophospholipase